MITYQVIGLMSGTSLDGLDIAYCRFSHTGGNWQFAIETAETIAYPLPLAEKLKGATSLEEKELHHLDIELGDFFGRQVNQFISRHKFSVDFIASHGHTVFHQPEKRFNLQIGNPQVLSKITGLPVVADFRTRNIMAGGQGAPLVPIGDKLLFNEYNYCINLGGFSNISYDNKTGKRIAFDICPVNIVLNQLAKETGKDYDINGETGKQGKIHQPLLDELNAISYYSQSAPKSLGSEWLEKNFLPVLSKYNLSVTDQLRTVYEHIVFQIKKILDPLLTGKILFTGGGAHNTFLTELLRKNLKQTVVLPDKQIIDYKEALIFAFLGVLRKENIPNCLSSYTGAPEDMVCGEWFE